ncbi:MAG: type II toxin-antitoxin system VapC family toxin [Acidobacteria bacterium]|nr:type II toxin-antitoxin system VapC family toxin [Acidobacteriota bacterium]
MRLLLDTVAFLWITLDDPKVSKRAREAFTDPDNEVFLSVVSAWEIAIKHSLGNLPLPAPPVEFIPSRRKAYSLLSLPLEEEAAVCVSRLPRLHADPFDRMLICQAIVHGLTVLTPDNLIAQYAVRVLW